MKKNSIVISFLLIYLFVFNQISYAEQSGVDELLNLLTDKKVLTIEDAAGFRADLAIKKQEEKGSQKEFNIIAGNSIKISGYTQVRYLQDKTKNETFDIRSVRLNVKGDISERFDYQTQLELGGDYKSKAVVTSVTATKKDAEDENSDGIKDKFVSDVTSKTVDDQTAGPFLLDAILGYKINSSTKISIGQLYIPFSLENLTSSPKLETINRSQVVEALTARSGDVIGNQNGHDIGVQIGSTTSSDFGLIEYALGAFNGSGINKPDLNNRKDVVARLVFHPVKSLEIGGSYYNGSYTLASATDKNGTRIRSGGEISYVTEQISIKGEYIIGKEADFTKNLDIEKDGWYAQVGYYFIPKEFEGVLKYDIYDSNKDKVSTKDETSIFTYGVNWYINKFASLQINYEQKHEKVNFIKNNALTGQVTLQF